MTAQNSKPELQIVEIIELGFGGLKPENPPENNLPVPKIAPTLTNRARIEQAIRDLTNINRVASREMIAEITGLKMNIVDDHIKRMKDDGKIRRVLNGVFELTEEVREDRAISMTYLPKGVCKLEIGDHCIELTLREARIVGLATAGVGIQFGR